MSDIRTQINRLRAEADFLVVHEKMFERYEQEHDRQVEAWKAEHPQYKEDGSFNDEHWAWSKHVDNVSWSAYYGIDITVGGPRQREIMTEIRRAVGGQWSKNAYSDTFQLSQTVNEYLTVTIQAEREQVCKIVGYETKTIAAVPAREAKPEETKEVPVWECPESILADEPVSKEIDSDIQEGTYGE